jgi:hypothetical protein
VKASTRGRTAVSVSKRSGKAASSRRGNEATCHRAPGPWRRHLRTAAGVTRTYGDAGPSPHPRGAATRQTGRALKGDRKGTLSLRD